MPSNNNTIEIVYEKSEKFSEHLPSHIWKKGENLKRPIDNVLKQNVNKVFHTFFCLFFILQKRFDF